MKKLLIKTYGCQMSVADSEVVVSIMQAGLIISFIGILLISFMMGSIVAAFS